MPDMRISKIRFVSHIYSNRTEDYGR